MACPTVAEPGAGLVKTEVAEPPCCLDDSCVEDGGSSTANICISILSDSQTVVHLIVGVQTFAVRVGANRQLWLTLFVATNERGFLYLLDPASFLTCSDTLS